MFFTAMDSALWAYYTLLCLNVISFNSNEIFQLRPHIKVYSLLCNERISDYNMMLSIAESNDFSHYRLASF